MLAPVFEEIVMPTDEPDDIEEEFQDRMAAYEREEPRPLSVVLPEAGVALPAPDELDALQLSAKLWELINGLALLGTFLHNTNHLSDRQLYAELWTDTLREPTVLMPDEPAFTFHIDMVGSGSEEDTLLYMKYYADEKQRRSWLKEWPGDRLPEHEDPPYDRDRTLPKAESRRAGPMMH
jgi:hypothetical protein